jgi:hypothetical protein
MLMQTNSYVVPKDKRDEHARLVARFRQTMLRLGCEHFEVYEQVAANWTSGDASGRFVQIMRFRDRKHQQQVQAAEKADATAQQLIREFCECINLPYQQQQGLLAIGYYAGVVAAAPVRLPPPQRGVNGDTADPADAAAASPDPATQELLQEIDEINQDPPAGR